MKKIKALLSTHSVGLLWRGQRTRQGSVGSGTHPTGRRWIGHAPDRAAERMAFSPLASSLVSSDRHRGLSLRLRLLLPSPLSRLPSSLSPLPSSLPLYILLSFLFACQPLERVPQGDPDLVLSAEPHSFGGDFTLVDHDDNAFRLADQRRPFFLFFGYASCPDACPQTLARLARVYALLGEDARDLTALFVSVDSKRDPPDVLKTYLSHFDVPAIGLTGVQDSIDAVVKRYAAHYEINDRDSAAGYLIDHSLYIYLIDQNGDVRFFFRPSHTAEEIATVARQLFR